MVFDLLLQKKKTSVETFYQRKKRILYNQDIFLNSYLKKYNIHKYLLFINKSDSFELVNFVGYLTQDVENIRFTKQSLFVQNLFDAHKILDIDEMEGYYRESVLLPKEYNVQLRSEKELWQHLRIHNFIPMFLDQGELFSFFICDGKVSDNEINGSLEFLETLYRWAKSYNDLHVENSYKLEADTHNNFIRFVNDISRETNFEVIAQKVLDYYMKLYKSTKAIMYTQNKGYYIPIKHRNVDFIKSYPKNSFEKIIKQEFVTIDKDYFEEEMGRGATRLVLIDDKNIIVMKYIFPVRIEDSIVNTSKAISSRLLECVTKK